MSRLDKLNDEELLTAWRGGDANAGVALAKVHYDSVFAFFLGKVGADAAAELTQDTFVALTESLDRFQHKSSVRTYLFAIARWKLVEHFRQASARRQRASTVHLAEVGSPAPSTASSLLEGRRRESLLVQALRTLSIDDQILLELKGYEDLSLRELGEVFEVPTGTIASRVRRARNRLAAEIRALADNPHLADETLTGLDTHMKTIRRLLRTVQT